MVSACRDVIDTKTQDFADFVQQADAMIDTVGGKMQDQLFTLAKPGGIVSRRPREAESGWRPVSPSTERPPANRRLSAGNAPMWPALIPA
jgi:hypothetical protein